MFLKSKIFLLSFVCCSSFGLSSCSNNILNIFEIDSFKPYKTLTSYIEDKDSSVVEWISQRTLSLRFGIQSEEDPNVYKLKFGTGWILNKVNNDINNFEYYIATNIHVANTLNELNSTTIRYEQTSNHEIKQIENYNFRNFSINFTRPNSSPFLTENNELIILEDKTYIGLSGNYTPKIVYTATANNLLEGCTDVNGTNSFINPYTNKIIENPAMDFAIIKVDFSSILEKTNFQGYSVKEFLNTYNNNPTKFANYSDFDYDESYYIAGFVQENEYLKINNRPTWIALNNIKLNALNNFQGAAYNDGLDKSITDNNYYLNAIKPENGIDYVTEQNNNFTYWYKNVASQILLEGANIGGGSSGSLICNSKKEIVGIYWGLYSYYSENGMEYNYGAIDLFLSNNYTYKTHINEIDLVYTFPKYNILNELLTKNFISKTQFNF